MQGVLTQWGNAHLCEMFSFMLCVPRKPLKNLEKHPKLLFKANHDERKGEPSRREVKRIPRIVAPFDEKGWKLLGSRCDVNYYAKLQSDVNYQLVAVKTNRNYIIESLIIPHKFVELFKDLDPSETSLALSTSPGRLLLVRKDMEIRGRPSYYERNCSVVHISQLIVFCSAAADGAKKLSLIISNHIVLDAAFFEKFLNY